LPRLGGCLILFRKSSKLDAKTQELRSQKFHDIQKESLRLAQKCMPQLEIIERQMDVQVEKSKLILTICQGRNTKSVRYLLGRSKDL
jgi:hypothetical protein